MTTLTHDVTHSMPATARPSIATVVVNAIVNFLRAWKNRRAFYRLGEMSDAELADIGLTRADLNVAIDLPFGSDPTAHLGSMAETRRVEALARLTA
ncbi:DUF1127 domain-containing protein [Ferrovibrio sp.]|uniref:DUF1127 domain-containing protein n=1 Tax=Ferrovibrio sp. TaxID=1917215 RepID=UPI003518FEC4